jgi:hypothetical protein
VLLSCSRCCVVRLAVVPVAELFVLLSCSCYILQALRTG